MIRIKYLPISFRVASLALGESYDSSSASEATRKDMGNIRRYHTKTTNTNPRPSANHVQIWDVLYDACANNNVHDDVSKWKHFPR